MGDAFSQSDSGSWDTDSVLLNFGSFDLPTMMDMTLWQPTDQLVYYLDCMSDLRDEQSKLVVHDGFTALIDSLLSVLGRMVTSKELFLY